jgi:hypothetical protein
MHIYKHRIITVRKADLLSAQAISRCLSASAQRLTLRSFRLLLHLLDPRRQISLHLSRSQNALVHLYPGMRLRLRLCRHLPKPIAEDSQLRLHVPYRLLNRIKLMIPALYRLQHVPLHAYGPGRSPAEVVTPCEGDDCCKGGSEGFSGDDPVGAAVGFRVVFAGRCWCCGSDQHQSTRSNED